MTGGIIRHGHSQRSGKSRTYSTWSSMVGRCTNPSLDAYKYYGERGICVCSRWRLFENFLADMGERPDGMEIERINNSSGYSPENCRWATRKEQMRNMRGNRKIEAFGKTLLLAEWSELTGIKVGTIKSRIDDLGWDTESALKQNPHPKVIPEILIYQVLAFVDAGNGLTATSKKFGIGIMTVWRIKNHKHVHFERWSKR